MKNKISDLRSHLFEQLERLNDDNLSAEQLTKEVERANAISQIGNVIVNSAKVQLMAAKIISKDLLDKESLLDNMDEFIETKPKEVVRPAAEYTNKNHVKEIESVFSKGYESKLKIDELK